MTIPTRDTARVPARHRWESAFDTLPSISLEALNEQAALMTRVDRKYLLIPGLHDHLFTALVEQVLAPGGARVLEVVDASGHVIRGVGYRSDYLDTPDDASHRGAAHARRRRFKVRLRTYLDSGEAHLEVKTRGGRGTTVKERAQFSGAVLTGMGSQARLTPEASAHVAARLEEAGVHGVAVETLHPALTTTYRRTTVLLPQSNARLTVDTHLELRTPDGCVRALDAVVAETKTPTGVRAEADRFLWRHGVRPARFSKYGTGRALMEPETPANRWHRAITRSFSTTHPQPFVASPTSLQETR